MKLTDQQITTFQEVVWEHFRDARREMPWRENPEPYYVLVSELMLQQTQVSRVIPKFEAFVARFPSVSALAESSLAEVLTLWSGLGYNRRAKFLHSAARMIVEEYDGTMPRTVEDLVKLPGVGPNTAGAIMAYAYNQPVVFVETNIRTVYFHHFFLGGTDVTDKQLREYVSATLDHENPREWYWALMDYGTYLKKQGSGRLDQSKHYKKQSPLKGSLREMRGLIIKALVNKPHTGPELLEALIPDDRFSVALEGLIREGLVERRNKRLRLTVSDDPR